MKPTLKLDIAEPINSELNGLPTSVWKSSNTTFFDPNIQGGQIVSEIEKRLLSHGHSHDSIKRRVFGVANTGLSLSYAVKNKKLSGTYACDSESFPNQFDVIVGNPTYGKFDHLHTFNECFNLLKPNGVLIILHPATQFLNTRKSDRRILVVDRTREIVQKYNTKITLVDGNKIFGTSMDSYFTPLSVTRVVKKLDNTIVVNHKYFNPTNEYTETLASLHSLYVHADPRIRSIRKKVLAKMENSIDDHMYRNGAKGKWYLNTNVVTGHKPKNGKSSGDFFSLVHKTYESNIDSLISREPNSHRRKDRNGSMSHSSKTHARNCAFYLMTKFSRVCVSFVKINGDLAYGELSEVPYMNFDRKWTDEMLFDYFGLTKRERKFINEFIVDWYERDVCDG